MKISSLCITSFLLVLASSSTSVSAEDAEAESGTLERALEMEIALARQPDLYLAIDLQRDTVEVKARGLVLSSIAARDTSVVRYRRFGSAAAGTESTLPATREVVASSLDERRKVVIIRNLRPYSVAPEEIDAADAAADRAPAPAETTQTVEPPTRYRAILDDGWELWIVQGPPGPGPIARIAQATTDGWRRWLGKPPAQRIVIGLSLDPEDARRLHHLVRPGTRLLIQ